MIRFFDLGLFYAETEILLLDVNYSRFLRETNLFEQGRLADDLS